MSEFKDVLNKTAGENASEPQEVICIVCPKGCHLKVDPANDYAVTGATCEKGIDYGKAELKNPVRVLTSTVKVVGSDVVRCPVRTNGSIPKGKIFDAMQEINKICLKAPVHVNDVVIGDLLGTSIDLIATRDIKEN